MTDEQKAMLGLLWRTQACEILLINLFAQSYFASGDAAVAARAHRDALRNVLGRMTVDGCDPAISDLISGETSEAVDRILEAAEKTAKRCAGRGEPDVVRETAPLPRTTPRL